MSAGYRYHRVSPSFWTDRKVLAWDDNTRLLALYIMTCVHRTTEGLFRLPKAYICADLGWDEDTLSKSFAILLRDGFIKYDEAVSVMLLTNALKWNPTNNDKHAMGAAKNISTLPETPLLSDFIQLAERYDKRLYKALVKLYGIPYGIPYGIQQTQSQTLSQTQEQELQGAHAHTREADELSDDVPEPDLDDVVDDEDDDGSKSWEEFAYWFNQAFGGVPNKAHYDEVEGFLREGMSLDAVVESVRLAAVNKARNWSYTRRILQNWLKEQLYTLDQVKEHEERLAKRRASPSARDAPVQSEGLRNALRSAEETLARLRQQEGNTSVAI